MKGEKTKREAELAMILDRFLSRSQLSALAREQDINWFEDRSIINTEVTVEDRLSVMVEDVSTLQEDINSFESERPDFPGLKKPAFPWFFGEQYTVEWIDGRVRIAETETERLKELRKEIQKEVEEFYDEHGGEVLRSILDGIDMVSSIEVDVDTIGSDIPQNEGLVSDLCLITGVTMTDFDDGARIFSVAKEVAPVIKRRLDYLEFGAYSDESYTQTEDKEPREDTETKEVEPVVAKAYPYDSGRDIVRLGPDSLLCLKLSPGDIIEAEGTDKTAARIRRSDRVDWNEDIVRMDGFMRQNAGVDLGEKVTIRKAETTEADRVVLVPPEGANVDFGEGATGTVKERLIGDPLLRDDVVPIISSMDRRVSHSPGQAIPLIAAEAVPEGVVVVTEDTDVVLRE
jgi:hypothetical protein